jgi:hypothetical protein
MPNELKTADGHFDADMKDAGLQKLISNLAASNAQIQDLQQGRCGMCNESPSNPVHGSGEGQHAFVTSEAEIMRLNAAAAHEAQRYAVLERKLERMQTVGAALVAKLDVIIPIVDSALLLNYVRGMPYEGPSLEIELKELRALVSEDGQ